MNYGPPKRLLDLQEQYRNNRRSHAAATAYINGLEYELDIVIQKLELATGNWRRCPYCGGPVDVNNRCESLCLEGHFYPDEE